MYINPPGRQGQEAALTLIFIAKVNIEKSWKQSKCLLTGAWLKKKHKNQSNNYVSIVWNILQSFKRKGQILLT